MIEGRRVYSPERHAEGDAIDIRTRACSTLGNTNSIIISQGHGLLFTNYECDANETILVNLNVLGLELSEIYDASIFYDEVTFY